MKKLAITFIALITTLVPASGVLAAKTVSDYLEDINFGGTTGQTDQLGLKDDIDAPISMIINAALALVGSLFLILSVYAGILWMTAAGKEEGVGQAKKILFMAIVGMGITMAAAAITAFIGANFAGV